MEKIIADFFACVLQGAGAEECFNNGVWFYMYVFVNHTNANYQNLLSRDDGMGTWLYGHGPGDAMGVRYRGLCRRGDSVFSQRTCSH